MAAVSERGVNVAREIQSMRSWTDIIKDIEANSYGSLLYESFWLERSTYLDNSSLHVKLCTGWAFHTADDMQ
ncbi:hypothetical protein DPV78_007711 [Talaromyces pinophilus]|jgi:hypothetical protein|nr:hypothetical protein DPV78_007711 [Talaromyces pinophilus]